MKKITILISVFIVELFFISASASSENMQDIRDFDLSVKTQDILTTGTVKPDLDFGKFPLYFIYNQGQVNEKANYYAKASRYTLWMTKEGLIFDSIRCQGSGVSGQDEKATPPYSPTHLTHPLTKYERDVSRLMFIGANKNPEMVPVDETKLRVNYFKGNDPAKWHCDVPTSQAVLFKDLYKNIELKVYGVEKQIEYDWIVKPGGNPGEIRFEYKNVKGSRIDKDGNLLIETDSGVLMHKRPVSYQKIGIENGAGSRVNVNVEFKKIGKNTYGFEVSEYDKKYELIIDPVVLAYSTYLGGSTDDYGYDIIADSSGNVYVTGRTHSTDFPTKNEYQYQSNQSGVDAFVTRIDTTKDGVSSLLYSTYLGGNSQDYSWGIAVDSSGNAYVTGRTHSKDFPCLNQYQVNQGGSDVFVTKIDTTKAGVSSLLYSTYLGGGDYDEGYGIAVDSSGNAYVTGLTHSTDFPTKNEYQSNQSGVDAFITRIDTTKAGVSSLLYSTYLGGGDYDEGYGIAVDNSGNAYVTGRTHSINFPTKNEYQTNQSGVDAFVTKIDTTNSGASSLIYSTYLGGGDWDHCNGITVDNSGNAYVTGVTRSTDFPCLNQYQVNQGGSDAFVTKLDLTQSGASSLLYSTYLGGGEYDEGYGIAVDSSGNAYVTGTTYSSDFPILNQYQTHQGDYDAFVAKIEMSLTGSTDIELNRTHMNFGAVIGDSETGSQTFLISNSGSGTLNWSVSDNVSWLSCAPSSGTNAGSVTVSVDVTGLSSGTYIGTITVSDPNASNSPQTINVTLTVYASGQTSAPFGTFETPIHNSTVMSSIAVTGWVLDDIGVESVKIYRGNTGSIVYIGDTVFVEGARPDIEQAYPDYPMNYKAGWGYMMLTNFLPNGGNGIFKIHAIAMDVEGNTTSLGTKTITVDNTNAVKPFGAIDTPTQGGTATGPAFRNQGWVLTPMPNSIPTDGSTINVYVDSVNLGHSTYNIYRADIAGLFPGYANSNGAHAYFDFDTTAIENGVHTIFWIASDSGGNADGIGSRYFAIQNSDSSRYGSKIVGNNQWKPIIKIEELSNLPFNYFEPIKIKKGYGRNIQPQVIYPDDKGTAIIEIRELERIVIHISNVETGYLIAGNKIHPLPLGSTLDTKNGIFNWIPGPGFYGGYMLVFVAKDRDGELSKKEIFVNIVPKFGKNK